jgi:hypothetical protein
MCKKCGRGPIRGPVYKQNEYGSECLMYYCQTCGYSWGEPTKDSRPAPTIPTSETE